MRDEFAVIVYYIFLISPSSEFDPVGYLVLKGGRMLSTSPKEAPWEYRPRYCCRRCQLLRTLLGTRSCPPFQLRVLFFRLRFCRARVLCASIQLVLFRVPMKGRDKWGWCPVPNRPAKQYAILFPIFLIVHLLVGLPRQNL